MKRQFKAGTLALSLVVLAASISQAEVKTRDTAQVKFEGMLGRMVGMFGGKAAKEGITSTNAVKGDRKMTTTDTTGRIVDLAEEKVYELDFKKKTYTVVTFAELRQQIKDAQEKAQREADKAAKEEAGKKPKTKEPESKEKAPEMEVDFDVKETGQKKSIAGYDAREVVMTITVREKGKTLEDSGGLVMTSDMWLGPEIPAMKELAEFELRYWKAIAPETTGVSAEQMAAVMAMYPMRQAGHGAAEPREGQPERHAAPDGHHLRRGQERGAGGEGHRVSSGGSGSGLSGMLARKMMKKDESKSRATIFTVHQRNARDRDHRDRDGPGDPGRLQAEQVVAVGALMPIDAPRRASSRPATAGRSRRLLCRPHPGTPRRRSASRSRRRSPARARFPCPAPWS